MSSGIRAVVIDDHPSYVDTLSLFAYELGAVDLVGTASCVRDGLALLDDVPCDVVVLSLQPDADALSDRLAAIRTIGRSWPGVRVVVVASADDRTLLLDAVQLGVHGWVERSDGPEGRQELLRAIREVGLGVSHLPAEPLRDLMAARLDGPPSTAVPGTRALTGREPDVLAGLAAGLSRREIGEQLELSPNAVRAHVRSILRKLHVHSASAAVAIAAQKGLDHA